MIYYGDENSYRRTCRRHMNAIQAFAQVSPENMQKVYTFVLCTIRMPLYRVPDQVREVEIKGHNANALWGWKRTAWLYSREFQDYIYRHAMSTSNGYADPAVRERELLHLFADMPGLGLVKGGFMAQLCFGVGGCLDSNNVERFGIDPAQFRAHRYKSARTRKTKEVLVDVYTDLLLWAGGSERLWMDWCTFVAERDGTSPGRISELHCEAIGVRSC